jgi:hypothetical protein
MELYTLDPLWRRQYVVDQFISLIWTERFNKLGDFQLIIESTYATRQLFTPDTYLAMDLSNYIMRVESIEDDAPSDGSRILTIKGTSYEGILRDRVAKDSLLNLTASPTWNITLAPAAACRKVFHDICIAGILNGGDILSGVVESSLIPSNIAEPADPVPFQFNVGSVYNTIQPVCDAWDLGFRFLRVDNGAIHFDIYAGSDRTSGQSLLTPVIFAPQLDNLQNTKELTQIDQAKNVAYVYGPNGFEMIYAQDVDPMTAGLDRRVLMVDASDITTSSTTDVAGAMIQRGKDSLAAARIFQGFDGEVTQNSSYQYGRDYNLGDLVEVRNVDGVVTNKRVTEQIFAEDGQGMRSYPTLTTNKFINAGSWLSWTSNKQWIDFAADTTSVWGNQP